MSYRSLEDGLLDLERHGELRRITEEVDPHLEMAAIHLRVQEAGGPALLFEQVKGTPYRAASNIFGTLERCRFLFRDTLSKMQQLIRLQREPLTVFKNPLQSLSAGWAGAKAMPLKNPRTKPVFYQITNIASLPLIKHWPDDGGAFITLPQVYTEDPDHPGVSAANLGMYRVQLNGNDYELNKEVGLHYQIHRGIGVHQTKALRKGIPLKVSIFVGGPPAQTLAAVMPLPEGMSEALFAGVLGGRRFRYTYADGYCISTDADFVITGSVFDKEVKPEGPFGDHLGYYSLRHDFPVMKVHKVYAKKKAIWPFTVVGRPPQEDTSFGALIHELTGDAVQKEIPGLKEINAVDAAGVHPLLLAVGSERYTPFQPPTRPQELLTIANHMLGSGQLSLAKYLLIAADTDRTPDIQNIAAFLGYFLERVNWATDLHFQTETTIDTLDYSGTGLNKGSKLIVAVGSERRRSLATEVPQELKETTVLHRPLLAMPGIVCAEAESFQSHQQTAAAICILNEQLSGTRNELAGIPLIVLCDDSAFAAASLANFLWVTFTKSNPSHDVYGLDSFFEFKHWGCKSALLIDARTKSHHAPPLEKDRKVEERIDRLFRKGGSLYGVLR